MQCSWHRERPTAGAGMGRGAFGFAGTARWPHALRDPTSRDRDRQRQRPTETETDGDRGSEQAVGLFLLRGMDDGDQLAPCVITVLCTS
jgi:hypothetical protein